MTNEIILKKILVIIEQFYQVLLKEMLCDLKITISVGRNCDRTWLGEIRLKI